MRNHWIKARRRNSAGKNTNFVAPCLMSKGSDGSPSSAADCNNFSPLNWLHFLSPALLKTGSGISNILGSAGQSRLHFNSFVQRHSKVSKKGLLCYMTGLRLNCGGRHHNLFCPVSFMILKT